MRKKENDKYFEPHSETIIVEKPIIKEVIKEVEKDCPPCPECPEVPIHIDTLHIKSDDKIDVKNGNVVVHRKNNWRSKSKNKII